MDRAHAKPETPSAEVVDFDAALLDACPRELKAELLTEADMLAQALPPERRARELESMARALSKGGREGRIDRKRARRLAAALRQVARQNG